MSEQKLFYALTGNLEWICKSLKERGISFEFDHIMGEGFCKTLLTLKEYEMLKKEAKNSKVNIGYLGISDICHMKKNRLGGLQQFLEKIKR